VLLLALSTAHKVGLAVVGAVFVVFALVSAMVIPRFRPRYPAGGLPAFIVLAFVLFFGMLSAVAVFGAEPKEKKETTTAAAPATTATTRAAGAQTVQVTETEFKITLATPTLKAGSVTFAVKNVGKIQHDLAIVGGPKTKLINAGGTATLTTTLKSGPLELYCTVPGHKAAGMDLKLTVS
jgi:nitrite reductase (NO-forming)